MSKILSGIFERSRPLESISHKLLDNIKVVFIEIYGASFVSFFWFRIGVNGRIF